MSRTRHFCYGRVATVVIVSGTEGKTAACMIFDYKFILTDVIIGSSLVSVPYGYGSADLSITADITDLSTTPVRNQSSFAICDPSEWDERVCPLKYNIDTGQSP